ncbi:hypothetical protein HRI96_03030 [Treponema parvum]|uniref:Zinc-finger domain-containing protein n=1 Tax=Treponema parvum TaxID=138851 RepID=A0A975EZH4_9SPIR|nr:zf-HC2 domain-containing protein [Treponema parvum]QTQ11259.1 hypothetical protein HRI96_03030 [Treponema parvum]QTQ14565.1 hypothetical protein HRQ91_08910 [Treponema parvum]
MFTCPEKDIHSIYLDNELPPAYVKEYMEHIQSCEKCRKVFERMKNLRDLFQKDSASLYLDETLKRQSYEKLKSRLAFHKTVSYADKKSIFKFAPVKPMLTAAAAAAVLAVTIPLRTQKNASFHSESELTPLVSQANPSPISENNIVISGNISREALASLFQNKNPGLENTAQVSVASMQDLLPSPAGAASIPVSAAPSSFVQYDIASNAPQKQVQKMSKALAAVDIFKPEFEGQDTIRISITIPSAINIPITSDAPAKPLN